MGRSNSASRASASRQGNSKQAAASAAATAAASAAVATPATPSAALSALSSSLSPLLASPAVFFTANQTLASSCLASTKDLYDLAKNVAPAYLDNPDSVPRLLTSAAFDSEQVFQQLSKHTSHVLSNMNLYMGELKKSVAIQKKEQQRLMQEAINEADAEDAEEEGAEDEEGEEGPDADDLDADLDEAEEGEDAEEEEDGEDAEEDAEGEDGAEDDEEAEEKGARSAKPAGAYKGRGGIEEDAFFSLDDMEKFADQFEDDNDAGDIDLNGSDEEGMDDEAGEDNEDQDEEDEDEEEDDAMDVGALTRRAIRSKHDKTLKPLGRPLREVEIDLEEDVGEIDANRAERYEDFFDPPAPELIKGSRGSGAVGKRGAPPARSGKKPQTMADHYAAEDANEDTYQDEDYTDEFGGAFKQLANSERQGLLGGKTSKAARDDEDDEAELAASAPVDGSAPAASDEHLSSYEKSSRKLLAQISTLEQKIVAPREWAQLGEVSGKARPVDALLTTNLEFEHAGKVAKPITQEYTEELEALIKRRILAEQFDDVVRRTENDLPAGQRKKSAQSPEVSDEKSAVGLGEVYAAEAAASLAAASGRGSSTDEKTSKLHEELATHMADLCHKLDALCNFHFTPRSIHAEELAVRTHAGGSAGADKSKSVSSIRMEDVMPSHMSSAAAIAPQESYTLSESAMVGASEKTSDEKSASRRRHKAQRKKKNEALAAAEKKHIESLGAAGRGNAAEGILRKAISTKEMAAATSARNVISAGGKGAGAGSGKKGKGGAMVGHGANTKFSSSGAFFGKMQNVAQQGSAKKQRTK